MTTAVLALVIAGSGHAADNLPPLDDPTRPPAGIAGDAALPTLPLVSGLSSVILPKKGRPAAIIDGQLVPLGASVRESRLVEVTEHSVVLMGDEGRERLYLTPDVEKKTRVIKAAPRRTRE